VIDWKLAGSVARGVAGLQPAGNSAPFADVAAPAAESERLVSEYTGLVAADPVPAAEALDRPGWIDANLSSLESVLEPVAQRLGGGLGPLSTLVGGLLAVEAGAVSGFLAGRVLGQYEFSVLDPDAPARLLFVAPNLAHAKGTLDADADELLRWVALHEITHALQFGGVPWLRPYLAELVRELLGALEIDPRSLFKRLPDPSDLRRLFEQVREDGIAMVAVGPSRRGLLDRVQCFMAVLEGYAEHVMDAVGAEVLEDLPALRTAMSRRRRDRSGFLRLLERLIGLDLKMRQYEDGKAFCDGVVERGGIEALNRVWDGPDSLPSVAELADPAGWLARTERLRLRPSA
jgi:coenzyme F420 biosynthesis associated uncharacterized protein